MSDKDKQQELDDAEAEHSPVEAPADDAVEAPRDETLDDPIEEVALQEPDMPEEAPAEPVPAKRRGNGIAWLALLASLIALAAVGYTVGNEWLAADDTTLDDSIKRLDNRLSSAQESLAALDTRIAELDDKSSGSDVEIDALRQELDERVRALNALPARMSTLESSVASLAGISEGARDAWLIAEAEYYMQIANAQLQLANKPELAALALRMADERVIQMSNPALIDVRRAIADELTALDGMEKPDIAGATMTLASLARVVESLPLSGAATAPDEEQQATDDEQSGLSRAWASVKNAMSGLVKVTPPDQDKLAVVHNDRGRYRIALVDLDSGATQVLTEGRLDESPSFAPNGSMIIYATEDKGMGVLAAVSTDGRIHQRLVSQVGDVREPVWSPFAVQ